LTPLAACQREALRDRIPRQARKLARTADRWIRYFGIDAATYDADDAIQDVILTVCVSAQQGKLDGIGSDLDLLRIEARS
jgi:hypothetical protein